MTLSVNEKALLSQINNEKLLVLASIYDHSFIESQTDLDLAKKTLAKTSAFKKALSLFEELIEVEKQDSNLSLRVLLASELLDMQPNDFDIVRKKKEFGDAFDAFHEPVMYYSQEYHVGFDLSTSSIAVNVYHEHAALLHDDEIIAEARSIILDDLSMCFKILDILPPPGVDFNTHVKTLYPDADFDIRHRNLQLNEPADEE